MAAKHQFILPPFVVERKLLEKCVVAATSALNDSLQPWAVDTQNAFQVVKIVEDFLMSSGECIVTVYSLYVTTSSKITTVA